MTGDYINRGIKMKKIISIAAILFLSSNLNAGWKGEMFTGVLFSGISFFASVEANNQDEKITRLQYEANKHRAEFARTLDIASYYEGAAYVEQKYNGKTSLYNYYQEQYSLNNELYQSHNKNYLALDNQRKQSESDAGLFRGISYGTAVIGGFFLIKACFSAHKEYKAKNGTKTPKNVPFKVIANSVSGLSLNYQY